MRIGINSATATRGDLPGMIADARTAADEGFATFWIAQIFGLDALTAIAVAGREVTGIEFGTAVVPIQPRHPQMLAAQALTTQAAIEDRLALGIGVSHRIVVEDMWGYSFARPATHMREYLEALLPLLAGESVSISGELVTCHGAVTVRNASPPPVLLAGLGPVMLELAGRMGDGTITWCTGPNTLENHIVPGLEEAAEKAGKPAPRVVASLPVCVTDDVAGTRARIAGALQVYGSLPSYRAMLDKEGVDGPADLAILGSEEQVRDGVASLADAGVTDFSAAEMARTDDERARTRGVLRSLL